MTLADGRLELSLAISDYDHTRDLIDGRVVAEGLRLLPQVLPVEEIFHRTTKYREWDVAEMSFAKYVALRSRGVDDLIALPVFPSRMFRQSSMYVLEDSPIERPEELAGRRVGLPEWAQTAAIYSRGWLAHDIGIDLTSIQWVQAGVNSAGRREKVELDLPPGIDLTPRPDDNLTDLLLCGELDAVLTAHPPAPFEAGASSIRHLLRDPVSVERAYFERTHVFPIMHVVVVRAALLERHAWIAASLYKAFDTARAASLARARDLTASRFPIPWASMAYARSTALFGSQLFTYGVEPNRVTLDAFLAFAAEQGVAARHMAAEELFAATLLTSFRI